MRSWIMRSPVALLPLLAIAVSACGAPKLALPSDPVGKAATCGVVAAADARSTSTQVSAPLAFDRQGQIFHYALLAGANDDHFSRDTVAAVMQRMQDIQDEITDGKWQALIQPCQAAFPQANPTQAVDLPSDPLEAEMGCYMLGKFMVKALSTQGSAYEKQLIEYGALNRKLDPKVARMLDRRGITSETARKTEQDSALSAAARLGSPARVMDACAERYI